MKANIKEQFLNINVRSTLPIRIPLTVSMSTTGIFGFSSRNLTKSSKVLPTLSAEFFIIGAVDFFLGLYLTFLGQSIFLAVKTFLSK